VASERINRHETLIPQPHLPLETPSKPASSCALLDGYVEARVYRYGATSQSLSRFHRFYHQLRALPCMINKPPQLAIGETKVVLVTREELLHQLSAQGIAKSMA
jgi:hypothetical protein